MESISVLVNTSRQVVPGEGVVTETVIASVEGETVREGVSIAIIVLLEQGVHVDVSVRSHIVVGSHTAYSVHGDAAAWSSAGLLEDLFTSVEGALTAVILVDVVASATKREGQASSLKRESIQKVIIAKKPSRGGVGGRQSHSLPFREVRPMDGFELCFVVRSADCLPYVLSIDISVIGP